MAHKLAKGTLRRPAFHRTRVVCSAMVVTHIGDRRCEGSQGQGHSSLPGSLVGAQGYRESQGSSGPTFPVKSGKHGQSQGTGIHISSPTFEANTLVPTTSLDDTINTLLTRTLRSSQTPVNPQRDHWCLAVESGPQFRPDSRWRWPGPLAWSVCTILHCVASTEGTNNS